MERDERRAEVMRYFAAHPDATIREAADALGIPKSTVDQDFKAATQRIVDRAANAYIGTIVNRNEILIGAQMPNALAGRAKAAEVIVQLQDQILKVFGLYAPTKSERTINIKLAAEQIAAEFGLDPNDVIAEAERIVAAGRE